MPINALLLTVELDDQASVIERLHLDPRVTVGQPQGWRLPVVLDTASPSEDEALVGALEATPGVRAVEIVMVDYSEDEVRSDEPEPCTPRHEESWTDATS